MKRDIELLKTYKINKDTLGDRCCRLFETKDGKKIAICRFANLVRVYDIQED